MPVSPHHLIIQTKQPFKDAHVPNLNPSVRIIAETKSVTNPYFATGAGGILQSVLTGFRRLETTLKGIILIQSSLEKINVNSILVTLQHSNPEQLAEA